MHHREMAIEKCIIGPNGIAQRAESPVHVGPPHPMMHFRGPWSQAPPYQGLPREISFVLPKCTVVGKFLPLYVYFTGQHNLKSFLSVSTPPYLEDENIFQKSASMVLILIKYRIEQRIPIFDSPQNKTKTFLWGFFVE